MKHIRKVLIANRGEIAVRIIRTCRSMGIATVAVFSEADRHALHVHEADEAIAIGPPAPSESYLVIEKILEAASRTGADAIHPGYGFLSENPDFSAACKEAGLVFIGPEADTIRQFGSKIEAKKLVAGHQVPVIPGFILDEQWTDDKVAAEAEKVGYPILIKASAGGGGKGMRVVRDPKALLSAVQSARSEAKSSFGNGDLLVEKYFDSARHVEIQIIGDRHGNVIHLFERECSVQRRHQKIIEESPSPVLNEATRTKMGEAAVNAARAVNYHNAGTVEFILTGPEEFYFLEVNTRLQVEHPVTEMVTGYDLVRLQIEVAEGKPLELEPQMNGHAIECRLYAEDPANNFLPVAGDIQLWHIPNKIDCRVDAGLHPQDTITAHYDPMIAKVIAHGQDREEALRKMTYALRHISLLGITNNKDTLTYILQHEKFVAGDFDTHFWEHYGDEILEQAAMSDSDYHPYLIAAFLYQWKLEENQRPRLKGIPSGWRNNFNQDQQRSYTIADHQYDLHYKYVGPHHEISIGESNFKAELAIYETNRLGCLIDGRLYHFRLAEKNGQLFIHRLDAATLALKQVKRFPDPGELKEPGSYEAPMSGQIVRVEVQEGQEVKEGDALVVINSMKMETVIRANDDGLIEEVFVEANTFVDADKPLIKLKIKE